MLGAVLSGCTGWAELAPRPTLDQQLLASAATPVLVSAKRFQIGVVPVTQFAYAGFATFTIAVTNRSDHPVAFGPEDIHVFVDGTPARLLSRGEHLAEPSQDADWDRFQLYLETTRPAADAPVAAGANRLLHWSAVLEPFTLRPGEILVGDIKAALPKPMLWTRPIVVDVAVEGEMHRFAFAYAIGARGMSQPIQDASPVP